MRRDKKGWCSRCHVSVVYDKLVWRGNGAPPLCQPCHKDATGGNLFGTGAQTGRFDSTRPNPSNVPREA